MLFGENIVFSPLNSLSTLSKIIWPCTEDLSLGSILSHSSILYVCPYASTLMFNYHSFVVSVKVGKHESSKYILFYKIVSVIWGPLQLYMNFRMSLSISVKKAIEKIFEDFIYLFTYLFTGEGKEKERERNINVWLPLMCPLLGTWPATQTCALTGNPTGNLLVHRPTLNPLSYPAREQLKFW